MATLCPTFNSYSSFCFSFIHLIAKHFRERGLSTHSINYFENFFILFSSAGLRRIELRQHPRQGCVLPLNYNPMAHQIRFERISFVLTGRSITIMLPMNFYCRLDRIRTHNRMLRRHLHVQSCC